MIIPGKFDDRVLSWIYQNNLKTSKNEPFDWVYHSFLIDAMCDWSQIIAIRKSAQIGFTETFGIVKSLFAAHYYGMSVIYTNTTNQASDAMVSTKVNTILENNPKLRALVESDKLSEKKIGSSFIHYRGTHSGEKSTDKSMSDKAISTSSDLNLYDERDRSDQAVIDMFASRLENSRYAGEWSFSNPSFPGIGTDMLYEMSDQKMWFVTCEHCGHKQYTKWFKIGEEDTGDGLLDHWLVDPTREIYICSKCKRQITDIARMEGEWIALYPDRDISGYWMSQMNYVHHSAKKLLRQEKTKSKDFFYNMVLGLPYRGTDIVVDRRSILNNLNPMPGRKPTGPVGMGVDNGVWKHYVIGDHEGILEVGKTKDWDFIERKFNEYEATMVVDPYPHQTIPYKLAERYPGRVFLAEYSKDKTRLEAIEWLKRKNKGVVDIQRTKYFDILIDKFAQREKLINLNERELDEYIAHWESLSRIDKEDAMGVPRPHWVSSNNIDHYAHATVYEDIALLKSGGMKGSTLKFKRQKEDIGIRKSISVNNWGEAIVDIDGLLGIKRKKKKDWRYV